MCGAAIAVESYLIFVSRVTTFGIEGERQFHVTEFAAGGTVTHAFLMRGDGLQTVSVRVNSSAATRAKIHWTVWRGYPDVPVEMSLAFEQAQQLQLRPGPQWLSVSLPRDGSSNERWYTVRLRLVDPRPAPAPQVSVVASLDNPDRGGVLWINETRQPGSLVMRAERRGRTLYRRFRADAEPHLPAALRPGWVQWGLVGLFHWAVIAFAYALLDEARHRPPSIDRRLDHPNPST